jgi:ABC-type glutathione transport system ATPase component
LEGNLKLEGFVNLEVLICSSHQITELFINNCPQLTEINCENNQITSLDISNCSKLSKTIIDPHVKLTSFKPRIVSADNKEVRNLLIVGITGNGKSTLANVLSGSDEFTVGESVLSETRTFKKAFFG